MLWRTIDEDVYKRQDGTLIDGVSIEAFKKQSETIFVELNQLFEKTGLDYKDVDEVIITDGPGSYTGIRIAMTIAKVFCTQMHKTLKCISTMQLFAGMEMCIRDRSSGCSKNWCIVV